MRQRSLGFLVILIAALSGFVVGRQWSSPLEHAPRPPVRPSQDEEIALLERRVTDLLAEREALRAGVRTVADAARGPGETAPAGEAGDGRRAPTRPSAVQSATDLRLWSPDSSNPKAALARVLFVDAATDTTVKTHLTSQLYTVQLQGVVVTATATDTTMQSAEEATKLSAARAQLARLYSAIAKFWRERNRAPYSLHELTLSYPGRPKGYLKEEKVPLDPWGGRYELRTTSRGETRVVTAGPDGVFGTTDDLTR